MGMGGPGGMLFDPFEANRRRILDGGIASGPNVPQRLPRYFSNEVYKFIFTHREK